MNKSLSMLFIIFIFYSFIGWIIESLYVYYCTKKLMNRGFLIGPYCPIYGLGCVLFITLLEKYMNEPLVLFILAITICSVLEYLTSWVMEKLFKARWWDYSDKKFNINGRVCLENMMGFGVGALVVMYVSHPLLKPVLMAIPTKIIIILAIVLAVIFITDVSISLKIITSFKKIAKSIHKDSTEEITRRVKEKLIAMGGLYRRLVISFNFEASDNLLNSLKARVKNDSEKTHKRFVNEKKKVKLLDKKNKLEDRLKKVEEEINKQ